MAAATSSALAAGRPLRDSMYGDLVWSRPGIFRREMLLEAGSEHLAGLRWEKFFSFEAVAESADGRWIIRHRRRGSLLGGCVLIEAGSGTEVATFKRGWRTGMIRFASGSEYAWERVGFWRPTYFWSSARQLRLITYKSVASLTQRFEMDVDPAARQIAELPALVLVGAYLMVMAARERQGS